MYRKNQNNINSRKKRQSAFVLMFCCILIAAAFFSTAFILTHFGHEHEHNGVHDACAVCIQIKSAENTLKQLGAAVSGAAFILAGAFAFAAISMDISCDTTVLSPVALKIRMNN